MRTFSKILSLVLVLAMMVGLCAFGATAEFKDQDQIEYPEACAVLNGIGVLLGDADTGNFRPKDGLKRAEACVILAKLLGNPEGSSVASGFEDCVGHWGEKYIAYCANAGIVSGYGDGNFGPNDKLTGSAFTLMCLRALGYDPAKENIGGPEWEIQTAKLVKQLGLAAGIAGFDAPAELTREQAAQIALNTLLATEVFYGAGSGTGDDVDWGRTQFANNAAVENIKDDDKLQLAEEYFPTLVKDTHPTADAFGRDTAYTWKLGTTPIYAAAAEATKTYTTAVSGGTIYTDLGKPAAISAFEYLVDGAAGTGFTEANIVSGNKTMVGGAGATTEVYYDAAAKSVKIVVVNTYVLEVASYKAAVLDADGDVATKAFITFANTDPAGPLTVADLAKNEFSLDAGEFAKGDVVLVTASTDGTNYTVQSAVAAESKDLTATSRTDTSFVADGTTYKYSAKAVNKVESADVTSKLEKTVYLDAQGNVIYVTGVAAPKQYAVVLSAAKDTSSLDGTTYKARLLMPDATTQDVVVDADADPLKLSIVEYAEIAGKYKLTSAGAYATGTTAVTTGTVSFTAGGASTKANAKTIFLVVTESIPGVAKYDAYTGISAVPTISAADGAAYVAAGGYATIVFINKANIPAAASTDVIFVTETGASTATDATKKDYYTYNAVVNGEITKIETAGAAAIAPIAGAGQLIIGQTTKDGNGLIVTAAEWSAPTGITYVKKTVGVTAAAAGVITFDTELTYNDDTAFYTIAPVTGAITKVDVAEIATSATATVTYYAKGGVLVAAFIQLP